jgi:hypothetical protein
MKKVLTPVVSPSSGSHGMATLLPIGLPGDFRGWQPGFGYPAERTKKGREVGGEDHATSSFSV